jgi:hypothetical protein
MGKSIMSVDFILSTKKSGMEFKTSVTEVKCHEAARVHS